jgi:uncharacterized membrane protein YjgN (DUF898 family)
MANLDLNDPFAPQCDPVRPAVVFHGQGSDLFLIYLGNMFFSFITFGIYYAWAKTRIRRFMWRNTVFLNRPFEYTGTGLELFLGLVIVMSALFGIGLAVGVAGIYIPGLDILSAFFIYGLIPLAIYRSVRYRLTRTKWSGIRGNLDGSAGRFTGICLWYAIIDLISLGLLSPMVVRAIAGYLIDKSRIGSQNNVFTSTKEQFAKFWYPIWGLYFFTIAFFGLSLHHLYTRYKDYGFAEAFYDDVVPDDELFYMAIFLAAFIIVMISIRMVYGFYSRRWILSGIKICGAQLHCKTTLRGYIKLVLINTLATVCTFGIYHAWAKVRITRFWLESLYFSGEPDEMQIMQDTAAIPRFGDGLAEGFDLDVGL